MKYGVINTAGEIVVELIYDKISEFSEGVAAVKLYDLWGFINSIGKIVIPLQFSFASSFCEGLAKVTNLDGITGYINHLEEVVIPFQFYFGHNFSEGVAFVSHPIDGFIFINKRGEKQFSTEEGQALSEFKNGLTIISGKNGWSVINKSGKTLFNRKSILMHNFSEGLAVFSQFDES